MLNISIALKQEKMKCVPIPKFRISSFCGVTEVSIQNEKNHALILLNLQQLLTESRLNLQLPTDFKENFSIDLNYVLFICIIIKEMFKL